MGCIGPCFVKVVDDAEAAELSVDGRLMPVAIAVELSQRGAAFPKLSHRSPGVGKLRA